MIFSYKQLTVPCLATRGHRLLNADLLPMIVFTSHGALHTGYTQFYLTLLMKWHFC